MSNVTKNKPAWYLRVAHGVARGVVYPLCYYVLRYRRGVVRENMERAFPECTVERRRWMEREFYRNFADMVMEVLVGRFVSEENMRLHVAIKNRDETAEVCRRYKGAFFMLGHFLNWEWIVDYANQFAECGIECGTVYKRLSNRFFDRLMYNIRVRRGGFMIEMNQLLRVMIGRARDAESAPTVYAMLADQRPRKNARHYWTTLLNCRTSVLTGTEQLAMKFGYPVFYAHFSSRGRGYCEMELVPIYVPGEGEVPEFGEITERFTRLLEDNIREEATRWLWTHKRFA